MYSSLLFTDRYIGGLEVIIWVIPDISMAPSDRALTMIGAGFAAALCIMVAAKAGSEMMTREARAINLGSALHRSR